MELYQRAEPNKRSNLQNNAHIDVHHCDSQGISPMLKSSFYFYFYLLCPEDPGDQQGANRQNTTHEQAFNDMSGGYNRFSK